MSGERIVKTRKVHQCDRCGKDIPKGSKAEYVSTRTGIYYDDEYIEQTGIEYIKWYWHIDINCFMDKTRRNLCKKGHHSFIQEMEPDGYVACNMVEVPTGKNVCIHCGIQQKINGKS